MSPERAGHDSKASPSSRRMRTIDDANVLDVPYFGFILAGNANSKVRTRGHYVLDMLKVGWKIEWA